MLSVQSSSLYRPKERHCGNSFTEDEEVPSADLLGRPHNHADITSFPTDGFLDSADSAPTVASMAAIILSSSPDLASSFFHGYFSSRSEARSPTLGARKTITTIKSTPEQPKQTPKIIPHNLSQNNKSQKKNLDVTKETDVSTERKTPPLKSLLRRERAACPENKKKTVKFADDNGLPLVVVNEFKKVNYFDALKEEILHKPLPKDNPQSSSSSSQSSSSSCASPSFSSIRYTPPTPPVTSCHQKTSPLATPNDRKLVCDFAMPCYNYAAFRDKVQRGKVSLENVLISESRVAGSVRVVNEVFRKKVFVRYTTNNWQTTNEVECRYVNNSNNFYGGMPPTDTFAFDIVGRSPVEMMDEIQFCIRFQAEDQEYWDNNDGDNYRLVSSEFYEQRRKVREMEKNW